MIACHRSRCTGVLPSRSVSSCQPRFVLRPSTDVLKYKLVKAWDLVPFFVTAFSQICFITQITRNENRDKVEHRSQRVWKWNELYV